MSVSRIIVISGLLLLLGRIATAQPPTATAPLPQTSERSPQTQPLTPNWNIGDKWTVESVGRPLQARNSDLPLMRPIQWQFALSRFEKSLTHDCFRVEIRCQENADGHPLTVLMVDRASRALRQITTEIPVPGGYQQMTLSYEFDAGQPAPVLGPLTALPIDLPVALATNAKGLESFQYTTSIGPPGTKEIGDLAFAHDVQQQLAPITASEVRQLLTGAFTKSIDGDAIPKSLTDAALAEKPITDVRLKSAGREIRQLWQPGNPWPIYCDNGYSVSRLVSKTLAGGEKERP